MIIGKFEEKTKYYVSEISGDKMERPREHEIDTEAENKFRNFLPSSWVIRKQTPDYGIDFDVDIYENGSPTGFSFFVQLKGTESPIYQDKAIIFNFEVDKLKYYLEKVRKPVFIIVIDVKTDKGFWLFAQKYIKEVISNQNSEWKKQKTIVLKIPVVNSIRDSLPFLSQTVQEGTEYVYFLQFDIPSWSAYANIKGILNDSRKLKEYVDKIKRDELDAELQIGYLYFGEGDRENAKQKYSEVFQKSANIAPSDPYIIAAVGLSQNLNFIDKSQNRAAVTILDQALQRQNECSQRSLIYFVRGLKAFYEFIFYFNSFIDIDPLLVVTKGSSVGTDVILKIFQSKEAQIYFESANELRSIVLECIQKEYFMIAVQLLVYLADTNIFVYPYISLKFGEIKSKPLLESAESILEIATNFATVIDDPSYLCFILQSKSHLMFYRKDSAYLTLLEQIKDLARKNHLTFFEKNADLQSQAFKNLGYLPDKMIADELKELNEEEELKIIQKLAESAGIDLNDPDNEFSEIARIGIKDRNPERVLKFCQHFHVTLGSFGMIGEMLGLPTAGAKFLYCDLINDGIYGIELDNLFKDIKEKNCDKCPNRLVYPSDWKWTKAWQKNREENMPVGLKNLRKVFKI